MKRIVLASFITFGLMVGTAEAFDVGCIFNPLACLPSLPGISASASVSLDATVSASLDSSVVGDGTLSTQSTTTATGGAGSAFNVATLTGNKVQVSGTAMGSSGGVTMNNSMGGQGILQANQNTGANSVQQNSVALTSIVGGNSGISGFNH